MKAAVAYLDKMAPGYVDVPEPIATNGDEILVRVKAVAIKHFDKSTAAGSHYSSDAPANDGRIIGGDGICLLEDGTRVYGMGINGMLAERALIHQSRIVPLPDNLDNATAAALPNAVIGAAMGLRFKADIQPGDVVLINGATGFTGRVAVQIAKHYGAKKIIATGRDQRSLNELLLLGADEIVSLLQNDKDLEAQLTAIHSANPIAIVIDYLWGHTAELLLSCLRGDGSFGNRIRYVSVGSMAGDLLQLSAATLRSVNLQLSGSGLGSWTKSQVALLFSDILPEMFRLAAEGNIRVATVEHNLEEIAVLWNVAIPAGHRLVVTIN